MRNRMLAIVVVILVIAGLRASYAVTMPLTVAAVVIAAVWPVKTWLDRMLPTSIAYGGTVLVLAIVLVGFFAAVFFSAAQAVDAFVQRQQQFEQAYNSFAAQLGNWGIPDPGGRQGYARLIGIGQALLSNTYTALVYIGFVLVLVILGLPEVPALRRKMRDGMTSPERRELLDTVDEVAGKIRSYLGVTTVTSVLTGVASGVWALLVGLDLALVWGVLNFLLNYVPVIGNLIGIIPPSLYALLQFDGWTMPLVVFFGFCVIQVVISNFIYPMLQGHTLSLSPAVVLISLAFWGWVWGIAGALIAVPLTAAIMCGCQHFRSTAWIARLLSDAK